MLFCFPRGADNMSKISGDRLLVKDPRRAKSEIAPDRALKIILNQSKAILVIGMVEAFIGQR